MRIKRLADPVDVEPPRNGEDAADCTACNTPDEAYIWVNERWRVRAMDRPTGLPMVLILECRSHLDLGDLTNLLAAELGVMTVRLERAIRSLDGVARVHVNRWGDGAAHLHMWFLARPYGRLQLRGTFLSLWDDILPVIPEPQWRDNLAMVAAWLAEFGGRSIAEPPHIQWQSPSTVADASTLRDQSTAALAPREPGQTPPPPAPPAPTAPAEVTGVPADGAEVTGASVDAAEAEAADSERVPDVSPAPESPDPGNASTRDLSPTAAERDHEAPGLPSSDGAPVRSDDPGAGPDAADAGGAGVTAGDEAADGPAGDRATEGRDRLAL